MTNWRFSDFLRVHQPSAKAYGEVRRFETTLYGALFRGQSKKDISMLGLIVILDVRSYNSLKVFRCP